MSDIASFISGVRSRGIAVAEISDADLTLLIGEALYEYSRYRPIIADTTFLTVADQQNYTWTEAGDALGLTAITCLWNPAGDEDIFDYNKYYQQIGIVRGLGGDWNYPSLQVIEDIKDSSWRLTHNGGGFQNDPDGGDIYLNPVPADSGLTVYVLYTKPHASVATIKSSDRDLFLDLIESACSSRMSNEISKASAGMKVKTPEYEIESTGMIKYWNTNASTKRTQFIDKVNAGTTACGRT